MSMQITVDPTTMTTEQREAVADFILTYPTGKVIERVSVEVSADTSKLKAAIAEIKDSTELQNELTLLQRESEQHLHVGGSGSTGSPDAAAAFGSAPAPLPPGAIPAPFTAAAAPSSIAHAAPPFTSTASAPVPVPPAPMPASAAQVAAAPMGSPAQAVDLDKNGLPWDARIHSEGKNKIADGSWRKKRGVDPALVATVEAELRALMGAPAAPLAPAVASPVAPVPPAPAAIPAPPPVAPSVGNVPPAPPASPSASVAVSPVSAPSAGDDARAQFVALVGRASAAIQANKVTQAEITQCCVAMGVPALPLLANRLDLVAAVAASVDNLIATRG